MDKWLCWVNPLPLKQYEVHSLLSILLDHYTTYLFFKKLCELRRGCNLWINDYVGLNLLPPEQYEVYSMLSILHDHSTTYLTFQILCERRRSHNVWINDYVGLNQFPWHCGTLVRREREWNSCRQSYGSSCFKRVRSITGYQSKTHIWCGIKLFPFWGC